MVVREGQHLEKWHGLGRIQERVFQECRCHQRSGIKDAGMNRMVLRIGL